MTHHGLIKTVLTHVTVHTLDDVNIFKYSNYDKHVSVSLYIMNCFICTIIFCVAV